MSNQVQKAKDYISKIIGEGYEVGIILGTGLSNFVEYVSDKIVVPYEDIPGFVKSTAPSHQGNLIAGNLKGKKVIIFQGRYHYYEGYSLEQVVFPTRVLKSLGAHTLIVTNAAGSLREEFKPGSIIMLKDHINFMGTNPLIGANDDTIGERFVSMHDTYCENYRQKLKMISLDNKIKVSEGVYIAVTGPSFETKSECQFFANIGADVVGMSTVPEVIASIHCGLKVLAFSIVTNYSNLIQKAKHSQEEIRENADIAKSNLEILISEFVKVI